MAKRESVFFCVLFTLAFSNISFGKQIELGKGWNAVGLPVGYEISSQANGNAAGEIYFATAEGRMEEMGKFNPRLGEGFWIYSSDGIDLELSGAPSVAIRYVVSLRKGWNFVSNPYDFAISATEAVRAGGESFRASRVVRPYFYHYREDLGEYVAAEILEPWKAYFIYSAGDTSLEFSPVRLAEEAVGEIEDLSVPDFLSDTPVVAGSGGEPDYIADQLLVSFRDGKNPSEAVRELRAAGFEVAGANTSAGIYNARANGITLAAAQEIASKLENVSAISKNYLLTPGVTPNDAVFANPPVADAAWGFQKIGMPQVWKEYLLQRQAIVATLDTGVDANHPELQGRVLTGKNFVNPGTGAGTWDDNGHGTNVAGIIAAKGNNSAGMAGVCWDCEILPVKVCGAAGQCPLFSVINGISYAASLRAPVINVSLGGYFPSGSSAAEMLSAALDLAAENGSVVVAAAGNDDRDAGNFLPAALPGAIAVGATDINDARAHFSNYGPSVDIAAPGVNIYTTNTGGGYSFAEGTSMSAAFVSGVAALMYSADATMSGAALNSVILESSSDPAQNPYKPVGGRINAAKIFSRLEPLQNFPPIITKIIANPSVVAPGGQAMLEVEAHDIDGDEISWLWAATAGQIDDPTARATTWRAGDASPGEHGVSVTVSDSRGASAIAMENIAVMGAEDALVVTPDYAAAKIGGAMRFSAAIVGADGSETPVSPIWEELSGLGEIDSAGLFTPGAVPGEAVVRATFRHLSAEARVRVYDHDATPMGGERAIELPAGIKEMMQTASGGSWSQFQTSAFLIGSVSVSVVFFESNGALDPNLYDWTPAQKTHAFAQIQQGLSELAAQEPRANISFVYEAPITFQTKYEPTPRPSSQDGLYITEFLQSEGFAGDKVTATFRRNDFIRTKNNTHWAYTIYMVAGEPYFDDGWFAYAYINGPYAMLTYENNGWGPNDLYSMTAHETGHIFGAGDQYSGSCNNCTTTFGYLQGPNSNCYLCPGSVPSLMKCNSMTVDASAAVQLGWRDLDGDDVLCPVDPQNGGSSKIEVVPEAATVDAGTPVDIKATLYNFKNHTIPGAEVEFSTNTGSLAPENETTYLEGAAGTTLSTDCAEHTVQISAPGAALASALITGTCDGVEPKNLQAAIACPDVNLTWQAGDDPSYNRYTVSRSTTSGGPYNDVVCTGISDTFCTDPDPGDGTYYYIVHAYKSSNPADVTGPSNETAAVVACVIPPSNLSAVVDCPDVELTWDAAAPAEYDRYTVSRSTTSGGPYNDVVCTGISAANCTDSDPGDGTYYYIVSAYKSSNPADQTDPSAEMSAVLNCSGSTTNGVPCDTEWPSFNCNGHNSGASLNGLDLPLEIKWEFKPENYSIDGQFTVADGKVFAGSYKTVYALDEETGEQIWEFESVHVNHTTPIVSNGKVIVGGNIASVYALNMNTGEYIWSFNSACAITSSLAVDNGKVFFGDGLNNFYALNENTGAQAWLFVAGGAISSSPAAADGKVFFGSFDGKLYALDQMTGSLAWSFTTGNSIAYSGPTVANGKVFFGSYDNKVYALNENTGEKTWDFNAGAMVQNTPAVADGKVFVCAGYSNCYALDENTGTELWAFHGGEYYFKTSPIYAGGKLILSNRDGNVYFLDANTGELLWTYGAGKQINDSVSVANGVVFIGSSGFGFYDATLHALGPRTKPSDLVAMVNCPDVSLTWTSVPGYDRYTVSRADVSGGPYAEIATGIETLFYTDLNPGDGTYYYIVHAYKSGDPIDLTDPSNEATAAVNCGVPPSNGIPCDENWPMRRCNNHNSGESASVVSLPLDKIWEFTTGSSIWSAPAVVDGKVFVSSNDKKVYALYQSTGAKIWEFTAENWINSSPAAADGMVFFGSHDKKVYALNQATGAKIWEFITNDEIYSSPAVTDGMVFIGSWDKKLYALNQATGVKIWEFIANDKIASSPAVANEMVFFGSNDKKVYALDQWSGFKIWEFTTGDMIISSPVVGYGKVFIGSNDKKIYALNMNTGAKIWEFTTGLRVESSPAVADGKVFIGSYDGKVYALDQNTGAKIWEFAAGAAIESSPAAADGKVFVGSYDKKVYVLDAATGAKLWEYTTGAFVRSSPALAGGKVFIGSDDYKLYAFGSEIGVIPPTNLAAVVACPDVELTWDAAAPAEYDRYTVSRSDVSGGPYTEIATGIAALSHTDSDPGDGTYYYIVHAYKSSDPADKTDTSNQTTAVVGCVPPPTPPSNLAAVVACPDVELTWDAAAPAEYDRYTVSRATTSGGPYNDIVCTGISTTDCTDSDPGDGTYYYIVHAYKSSNPADQTASSGQASAVVNCVPPPPMPPSNLAAVVDCPDIELTWDAAAPAEYDRYTVSRADVSGGPYTEIATGIAALSYTDAMPGDGTYYYIVHAYKSSAPSDVTGVSNETYAETACAPYLNIFGTCEPELAWNPAPDPAMDRFRVLRSASPGGPYTEIVSGLSSPEYQDSTVADASTYFYVVKAYRSSDPLKESDPSNEVALTTECAPDGLEALMSCPQVNIKWEPSNGTQFDRFTLYRSTVSGGPYAQVTTGLEDASYTDTPPSSSGETYYYVVRAYKSSNPAITTGYSNELEIENFLCPYPEPADLVATLDCPDVSLSWDGVPTASGYKLYRADASGGPYSLLELNPSNPYADTTVVDGQTYHYVVTAYYSTLPDEESGYSNEATVAVSCLIPPPTPPSNLAVTGVCPDIELTWDAAAPAEYDRYAVSRATAPGGPYAQIATGIETLSYADLDPGDGTYYYIVHAYKSSNPADQTASSGQASILLDCSVSPPNDDPCDASWPGFLCNNSNTGESVSVVNLPLAKAWEFNTGGQVFSSPAIAEGKVFVGSNNKKVYALDQNTGAKIWEYKTGNVVYSAPAVADGKVFVGSADKKVYAFDQNTGAKIWEYATGGAVYSSPAIADGKVFIGSYDNRIYALDQNTGAKIWEYVTGGPIYSSPAVADGKALVGSGDKKFYALDQNTGEKIWEYFAGRFVISSPAVAGGKVFVGSYDNNRIYALDLSTGDKIWEYETDSLVWASLAAANGKVFFGLLGGKVYALDQNTGAKIWEHTTGGAVYSSPAVADGKVFIGSNDKKVYALDQNTGANLWEYATGSGVRSSPAVADGRVFFGSNDGKMYSFGP